MCLTLKMILDLLRGSYFKKLNVFYLIVYLTTKWHSKEANVGDIFVLHHPQWFADHEVV
jgi:hypothetical protein